MVKQAEPAEAKKILSFYHKLIDDMAGTPYKPKWEKGVYPLLEDLETSAEEGNLFYEEEDGTVIGAFILNHEQADNYKSVPWSYDADQAAVIHLFATAANMQGRGIGKRLLGDAVEICKSRGDEVIRLDTLTFHKDLLVTLNNMEAVDADTADTSVGDKLAYIMNAQAEKKDMNKLSLDGFLEWADQFDGATLFLHMQEFITMYLGSRETTSDPKKAATRPTGK